MDFNFSDDQEQLRDAVRKWVDKGYDFERRRTTEAAGGFSHWCRWPTRNARRATAWTRARPRLPRLATGTR